MSMSNQRQLKQPRRRGRPPREEALDTRGLILQAALTLFATHGFAGTSVRQIARAVDLTESALYAHFSSKQVIYDELFRLAGPHVVHDVMDVTVLAQEDPSVALTTLVDRVVDAWDLPQARLALSMLLRDGTVLQSSLPGDVTLLSALAEVQAALGTVLQRWMDTGQIVARFAPEQLVWELFGPIAYLRILYLHGQATDSQRVEGRAQIRQHVTFFLACILPYKHLQL